MGAERSGPTRRRAGGLALVAPGLAVASGGVLDGALALGRALGRGGGGSSSLLAAAPLVAGGLPFGVDYRL